MPIRFYTPSGKSAGGVELAADYAAAEKAGAGRVGKIAFYYRDGLRVCAVPLEDMTDLQITCLSNMITLTPGTFTLDMSPDRKTLFVHAMYIDTVQEAVDEIKNGFERQVRETLR